jgi:hypothetical protein
MMKHALLTSALAALLLAGFGPARSEQAAPAVLAAPAPSPYGKLPLLEAPLALRGTLGDAAIQANLRAKEIPDEGFEGDYFLFGHSQKILLAGEVEGDDVFMEESENGTDVSGQWTGKLVGDTISGNWQSFDGLTNKPFSLRIVRAAQAKPVKRGRSQ